MSQDTQSGFLPPMLMFRSFLTLASGYVLHIFAGVLITVAVGNLMFPQWREANSPAAPTASSEQASEETSANAEPVEKSESAKKSSQDGADLKRKDGEQQDESSSTLREIPRSMMMIVLALSALVNFFIGAYVVRTAPFSHQTHSIFLAVMLFVSYLQRSITETPDKKSVTLMTMIVCSAAVFLGGRWMAQRMARLFWEAENADHEQNEAEDQSFGTDDSNS